MSDNEVRRTERGWAGHFICAYRCLFWRNTLLECGDVQVVVSTVGAMLASEHNGALLTLQNGECRREFEPIGAFNRYYETMAFHADQHDVRYHDIDVSRQVYFRAPWSIDHIDADDKANDMHEAVVAEIAARLAAGERFESEEVTA